MVLCTSWEGLNPSELMTYLLNTDARHLFDITEDPYSARLSVPPSLEFWPWLSWLQRGCLSFKHHVFLRHHLRWEWSEQVQKGLLSCIREGKFPRRPLVNFLLCHWPEVCHMSSPRPSSGKGSAATMMSCEEPWLISQGWDRNGAWPRDGRYFFWHLSLLFMAREHICFVHSS